MGIFDDLIGDDDMGHEYELEKAAKKADKETKENGRHTHYITYDGFYFPQVKSHVPSSKTLKAGVYEVGYISQKDQVFFSPMSITSDELVDLNESATNQIVQDVNFFLSDELKARYKKYGLLHKRGAILEGIQGTGKSTSLTQIARKVIDQYDAVVLFNPDVSLTLKALRIIREIETVKPIIVIYEEFDSLMGGSQESTLLTMLDGQVSLSGVYFLCTTNYISRIPARMKNRPSRFALVVHVDKPTKADREKYIRTKLLDEDESLVAALIDNSDGLVIDQIKDLIISVCCFNYPMNQAVKKIKDMQKEEVGLDDYNESVKKDVFKSLVDEDKSKSPLRPL